ncbi:hypothetical protein FS749_010853 [Ceratobasidium sp. UAMH 11750]|nr:hypothetical protein FS749_010853 [Ceratobasidium sp. UAMH 11750]
MYHFSAANIFNYVDTTGAIKTIYAQANSEWFVLEGRRLAESTRTPTLSNSGVTYTGCSATQQAEISAAATASNEYVAEVKHYLAGISATNKTPRYTTWFGDFTTERYNVVVDHFSKISTDATSTNYDCGACAIDHTLDYDVWMAYVYPGSPGKIYLCGNFWEAPLTGPDSRAGTIIRGNSYFEANGKTYDITYGQDDAKKLVKADPGNAIWNADSYEYL